MAGERIAVVRNRGRQVFVDGYRAVRTRLRARKDPVAPAPLERLVPAERTRTVVVLVDERTPPAVRSRFLSWDADDRVVEIAWTSAEADVDRVIAVGPVNVLVDLRDRTVDSRRDRWHRLFLLLAPQGTWVVPRLGPGDLRHFERAWLRDLTVGTGRVIGERTSDVAVECLRCLRSMSADPELLVLRKQFRHVAKLRDAEADTVLRHRDPELRVTTLRQLPAHRYVAPTRVIAHRSDLPQPGLETSIDVPPMTLRHYDGPLTFGGRSLLYARNSALAESFRFPYAEIPNSHHLRNFTPRIGRVAPIARADRELEGTYFHLDPSSSGHFGHVTTEMLGRLWGWDEAKRRFPDMKALLRPRPGNDAALERAFLTAYGIDDEDIVLLESPATVQSTVTASVMWHNWPPYFMHPGVVDVWNRIADRLIDPASPAFERIFVSRRDHRDRRRCQNADEVEALFEQFGFTTVYPEDYPVAQQAGIFANAKVVAGFGGSGMFSVMFARRAETVIVISHEAYTARNEHLFTLGLDSDVHYFWSSPDIAHPDAGFTYAAYESEWSFDFERNREPLEDVLRAL